MDTFLALFLIFCIHATCFINVLDADVRRYSTWLQVNVRIVKKNIKRTKDSNIKDYKYMRYCIGIKMQNCTLVHCLVELRNFSVCKNVHLLVVRQAIQ